jgi:hypothetical protein
MDLNTENIYVYIHIELLLYIFFSNIKFYIYEIIYTLKKEIDVCQFIVYSIIIDLTHKYLELRNSY